MLYLILILCVILTLDAIFLFILLRTWDWVARGDVTAHDYNKEVIDAQ